ncbi:bifunctional phosphopantothenoylcysteine decarboxylase/phosphopantothenate--cysteine ligase CoaBC [Phytomonospora sp. NPDC050363]|uniref:bifunctional phosphopantothenoylcysteine decarboxylase/phosphopantothenate--cysteine ligase CoaBC n=1 Tax=Phytomonospora sp. NPDC050363 TaxID=3155642 RepID=UPI0033FF8DA7
MPTSKAPSRPRNIVFGVGGGIAAYKACELLRLFTESGHHVRVVPTEAALRFVGAPTWEALSGQPVATEVWDRVHEVPHVRIGKNADLVVIVPATANILAKAAHGLADDLLTNTLLTARCPVLFSPAMHTEMWQHPATVDNVATLRSRGAIVLDPAVGRLTGADTGPGRLPDPAEIFAVAVRLLDRADGPDLTGKHVVVTAGGTREPIDPVRFIGNRSSGKQGYAIARAALARGAEVTLVSANVALPDPAGAKILRVETTAQLREEVLAAAGSADIVVMAAAPADFRPADYAPGKIKKAPGEPAPTLELTENPDIAAELGAGKPPGQILVTFAAETAGAKTALEYATAKLVRKKADLSVLNTVGDGKGFAVDDNAVTLITPAGVLAALPSMSKDRVADAVLDAALGKPIAPDCSRPA